VAVRSVSLDCQCDSVRTLRKVPIKIGQIEAIFRYPVKSMRGEPLDNAHLAGMASMAIGGSRFVGLTIATVSLG